MKEKSLHKSFIAKVAKKTSPIPISENAGEIQTSFIAIVIFSLIPDIKPQSLILLNDDMTKISLINTIIIARARQTNPLLRTFLCSFVGLEHHCMIVVNKLYVNVPGI